MKTPRAGKGVALDELCARADHAGGEHWVRPSECGMWFEVGLPYVCERMIAFSIPEDDEVWVLSYEGLHRISLAPEVSVWTDPADAQDYRIYDTERSVLTYRGRQHRMLGLHGGRPLLKHPNGDELWPDFRLEQVEVRGPDGEVKQTIEFSDLSADWGVATFSPDGRYLAIGVPNQLFVYRQARATGLHPGAIQISEDFDAPLPDDFWAGTP